MRRGDVWTTAGGNDYAGKPRPVVIIQNDSFGETSSITICPFTSDTVDAPLVRLLMEPTPENGLRMPSRLMVDKVTTVAKTKLGVRIGRLASDDMARLDRELLVFLALAV